jgi:anti-sigma factor RsiW
MAKKNKVSVSTEPKTYRLTTNERRAARLAEISNQQADLKREAAERRAKRADQAAEDTRATGASTPDASVLSETGGAGQSNSA